MYQIELLDSPFSNSFLQFGKKKKTIKDVFEFVLFYVMVEEAHLLFKTHQYLTLHPIASSH